MAAVAVFAVAAGAVVPVSGAAASGEPGATREGAADLGDITGLVEPRFPKYDLDLDGGDAVHWFSFSLSDWRKVNIGLRQLDADADLFLEDEAGTQLAESRSAGTANEKIELDLGAGTYYIEVRAVGSGANSYKLRHGVSAADPPTVEKQETVRQSESEGEGEGEDPEDDFSADATTEGVVEAGGSATGELEVGGDVDWFKVDLAASSTYIIELKGDMPWPGAYGGTLGNPRITGIYDNDSDLIEGTSDDNSGTLHNARVQFAPSTAGRYYIAAAGRGTQTGTYTVEVAEAFDDYSADTSTEASVTAGGANVGSVDSEFDVDWFAVVLDEGATYRVRVVGDGTSHPLAARLTEPLVLADPDLMGIYDAGGNLIDGTSDDNSGGNLEAMKLFTPTSGGVHYIAARASLEAPVLPLLDLGLYMVIVETVTSSSGDDYAADGTTTGTVEVGGRAGGRIETAGDVDWFAVTLTAGRTYRIDMLGTLQLAGSLHDPLIVGVYDPGVNLIEGTRADDGRNLLDARLYLQPTVSGVHYIAVTAYRHHPIAGMDFVGTYQLEVSDLGVLAEAGEDLDSAVGLGDITAVRAYRSVAGLLSRGLGSQGDDDVWSFTVTRDRLVELVLTDLGRDANLMLRDEYGNMVASSVRGGTDDDAISIKLRDGTYFAEVRYFVNPTTYTLRYRTKFASLPDRVDDYRADTSTTGTIDAPEAGAKVLRGRGRLNFDGDRDWLAVELTAGTTYQFDVKGLQTGNGTLNLPKIGWWEYPKGDVGGIIDSDGNRIPYTTSYVVSGGPKVSNRRGEAVDSRVVFTPPESGTYFVDVGVNRDEGGIYEGAATGTYAVEVSEYTEPEDDDYSAFTDTTGTFTIGSDINGVHENTDDVDWFAVALEADVRYSLWGAGIYDSDGAAVDGLVEYEWFRPATSGTYYIAIRAEGRSGPYSLPTRVSEDEYSEHFLDGYADLGRLVVGRSHSAGFQRIVFGNGFDSDLDGFKVRLRGGERYRIDTLGVPESGGTSLDPIVSMIERLNGTIDYMIHHDPDVTARISSFEFEAPRTTNFYLTVESWACGGATTLAPNSGITEEQYLRDSRSGDAKCLGTYTVRVVPVVDPGTSSAAAWDLGELNGLVGSYAVQDSLSGESGDKAYFEFSLSNSATVDFAVVGLDAAADLYVEDDAGKVLFSSLRAGPADESVSAELDAGTYFVRVEATSAGANTYDLEYELVAGQKEAKSRRLAREAFSPQRSVRGPQGSSASVVPLPLGISASGKVFDAGDLSWFSVDLVAGRTYVVDVLGESTGQGTLSDPVIASVMDPARSALPGASDDDSGAGHNSRSYVTAATSGVHYVVVGGDGDATGTFLASVREIDDDVPPGSPGAVPASGTVEGVVDYPGDEDRYGVLLRSGQQYLVGVAGADSAGGALSDPALLGIYGPDGALLAGSADSDSGPGRDARVMITPTETGDYQIAIGADGHSMGRYRLSVRATPRALVSNLDHTAGDGQVLRSGDYQAFTTGDIGASLDSVVLDFRGFRSGGAADAFSVSVRAQNTAGTGPASSDLVVLSTPGLSRKGRKTFRVPAGQTVTLQPDSTYYVVFSFVGTGHEVHMGDARSLGEDSSYLGWSIRNVSGVERDRCSDSSLLGRCTQVLVDGEQTYRSYPIRLTVKGVTSQVSAAPSVVSARWYRDSLSVVFNEMLDGSSAPAASAFSVTKGPSDVEVGVDAVAIDGFSAVLTLASALSGSDTGVKVHYTAPAAGQLQDDAGTAVADFADQAASGPVDLGALPTGTEQSVTETRLSSATAEHRYRFTLASPKQVRIGFTQLDAEVGLKIEDGSGALLHQSSDGRPIDERLEAGTFYVRVVGDDAVGGRYTLSYQASPDVHGSPRYLAVRPASSGMLLRWSEPVADASSVTAYAIERRDLNSDGTLADPPVLVATRVGTPSTSWLDTTAATEDARYRYRVRAVRGQALSEWSNEVAATYETGEGDDYPADSTTHATLAVGGAVDGWIDGRDDVDYIAVPLAQGRHYKVVLHHLDYEASYTRAGLKAVRDSSDSESSPPGHDAPLLPDVEQFVTPAQTGRHFIVVAFDSGPQLRPSVGAYRVSVFDVTDTVYLGLAAVSYPDAELESGVTPESLSPDQWATRLEPDDYADERYPTQNSEQSGGKPYGTVAVGGTAYGRISDASDVDMVEVELTQGRLYRFDLEGQDTGHGTLADPKLSALRGPGLASLTLGENGPDGGVGRNALEFWTPEQTGTHYLEIGSECCGSPSNANPYQSGSYRVAVRDVTASAPVETDDTSTPAAVSVGGSYLGALTSVDEVDWVAIELLADGLYTISASPRRYEPLGMPGVEKIRIRGIFNESGQAVVEESRSRYGSVKFIPRETGRYFVSVVEGALDSDRIGGYELSVAETLAATADLVVSARAAGTVELGTEAAGEIVTIGGDAWFAVELTGLEAYTIAIEGLPSGSGTLPDPFLRGIYAASSDIHAEGVELKLLGKSVADGGRTVKDPHEVILYVGKSPVSFETGREDVGFEFKPKFTNTYYIRVAEAEGLAGTFKLTVSEGAENAGSLRVTSAPKPQLQASVADPTGPVAAVVGVAQAGEINDDDDTDVYSVELLAGTAYVIEMKGSWTGGWYDDDFAWVTPFSLFDPLIVRVYDPGSPELNLIPAGSNHDDAGSGKDSRLEFTPTASGTYHIEVGSGAAWTGTFQFKVSRGQ